MGGFYMAYLESTFSPLHQNFPQYLPRSKSFFPHSFPFTLLLLQGTYGFVVKALAAALDCNELGKLSNGTTCTIAGHHYVAE